MEIIDLIKQLLENGKVRDLDITFSVDSIDVVDDLVRFCGEHAHQFDVYEVWEKGYPTRLVRIRV